MSEPVLLEVRNLSRHFTVRTGGGRTGTLHAVDDVNLVLPTATIIGVVGESGSGKTTLARLVSLFYSPTSGEVLLRGEPAPDSDSRAGDRYRDEVQLMFQDPFGSLNAVHTVRYIIGRTLKVHGFSGTKQALEKRIIEMLKLVRLEPADEYLDKYPYEMSGGQRQRVVLARALAVGPKLLLADEPVSMLDVSIRAEMLNLLTTLRDEQGLSLLYVTHDMAGARYLCDRIIVMYAACVVEEGPAEQVVVSPKHPYTQLLIACSPDPVRTESVPRDERFGSDSDLGDPPNVIDPQPGCRFAPRCPHATQLCRTVDPPRVEVAADQWASCWIYDTSDRPGKPTVEPELAVTSELEPAPATPTTGRSSADSEGGVR